MGVKRAVKKLPTFQLVLMLVLVSGVMFGLSCEKAFAAAPPVYDSASYVAWQPGWDGVGLNPWSLDYYFDFSGYLGGLTQSSMRGVMTSAMQEWSNYVQLDWTEILVSGQANTVDIGWEAMDEASGTLAYAYYPAPIPNSEPVAGDMFFDNAENWTIGGGGGIDLFAVTLHELGHSLGLKHSDDPDAVMYAWYTGPVAGLDADDIVGIRSLYATGQGGVYPIPEPATILLLGSGLLGLFGFKKRRGYGEMG